MTAQRAERPRTATSPPRIPKTSFASSAAIRARMQAQRRKDTKPELALRSALHARGLRYFVHRRPLPALNRQADIVFPRAKVAVFVQGCWWHACPDHSRVRGVKNQWYWPEKLLTNVRRDEDTDRQLQAAGWAVVRVWEHENPADAAAAVEGAVRLARAELANKALLKPEALEY